jgi:hypothetical protein
MISFHLPPGIAEDNSLRDSESIVEITQGVEFPLLLFHSDEELLDAFQGQLVTLDQNSDGVRHELVRHLENLCSRQLEAMEEQGRSGVVGEEAKEEK